jgi:hypothetical protein
LDLGHLYFDIVSDLELRISDFASLGALHLSRALYKSHSFMQNKPNFRNGQMNVSAVLIKEYRKNDAFAVQKTNPIQTQFKPNSNPIQTQLKPIKPNTNPNKPNSNPIQTHLNPIKPKTNPIRTQFKANPCPQRRRRALPQSRHSSQLHTAEIKALFCDYRIRLFYLICTQRIEYGARNDCGQSLFEGQDLCSKTIRFVYFNRLNLL